MKYPAAMLLIAMSLAAQGPQRDATGLAIALASAEPETVAFAAHDARALRDKTLVPALQRELREWTEAEGAEASVVHLHLLDALLASKAKVPPAELLPLLDDPRCGTAAFALLAREPKQNEAELLDATSSDQAREAVDELLAFRGPTLRRGWTITRLSARGRA